MATLYLHYIYTLFTAYLHHISTTFTLYLHYIYTSTIYLQIYIYTIIIPYYCMCTIHIYYLIWCAPGRTCRCIPGCTGTCCTCTPRCCCTARTPRGCTGRCWTVSPSSPVTHMPHILTSAANRLIGEVVQSRRRPLLGPSPGWKRLLALSHLRHY